MSACRLCLTELTASNKCKSHIFPISLIKLLSPGALGTLKLVGTEMNRSKRIPKGSYDSDILCRSCDTKIGKYDKDIKEFIEDVNLIAYKSGIGWSAFGVKQHSIKMFCLSYLWRCSITTLPEFKGINVGDVHEEKIRQMILNDDSGSVHDYTVSLAKYSNDDGMYGGILYPAKTRLAKLVCYTGNLPKGYRFWIKVDTQNEQKISSYSVGAIEPLLIGNSGDFHSSKEMSIMIRAAKRSK